MRLKSQYIISIAIFIAVLIFISTSAIFTNQQVAQINNKEQTASNIQTGASNLAYISNDYFLYQQSAQLSQWQNQFSPLSIDLSKLTSNGPKQQAQINNVNTDLQNLGSVFNSSVLFIETTPPNENIRSLPAFQTNWNRLAVQNQALTFDASVLSKSFENQADQMKQTSNIIILGLIGAFGAYFVTVYFIVYRRTLRSITKLQDGTKIIGSGNLDYSVGSNTNDEIGELSRSFNQMTANLKTVTASKTDLEQAQASLRESEQRWSTTLASVGDAVIATDTSGKIVFMNGEAEELTGWTLSEVSQKPVTEVFNIVNEQTRLEVENPVDRILKEGLSVGLANHTVLIRKDRTEIPIDDSGAPIKDKDGKTTGVVLIFRDITERKRQEREIESIARFPSENPNPVFRIDGKGTILYDNLAGDSLLSVWNSKIGERAPEYVSRVAAEALASDKRVELEETYGAKTFSLLFAPVLLEGYVNIYATDITERKRAEESLAIAKNQLAQELAGSLRLQELSMIFVSQDNIQALLDKIVLAAIEIMHADMGNMQRITKEGELRIVAQNGFKQPFLDFFNCVSDDSHAASGFAMASKKRVIIGDVTQSPIFLNTPALDVQLEAGVRAVVSTPFFTRSGEFLGVISTHYRTAREPDEFDLRLLDLLVRQAADFVERTQNEQKLEDYSKNLEKLVEERTKQLRDSERLATIGATAGMVGHDIRNPLQAITGDVYLAKTELASIPESEEKKSALESLQEIEKNIDYINKIVQDLQDFARPLKPNIEEVDLKLIIEDLLKKNGLPENVKVSVKVESDARKIVADSTFVNRVMYNLVNNAVQAMPKGGKLTIHAYKEANDVLIAVKDTGVGISEAVKGKLFTPMFTTKAKGQGFGLPVIKRMTEALGGTVTFESQEGKGTTFIIRLPPPQKR